MIRRYRVAIVGWLVVLSGLLAATCTPLRTSPDKAVRLVPPAPSSSSVAAPTGRGQEDSGRLGRLPLGFELNTGQTAEQVDFLARGRGYSLFLSGAEATLTLQKSGQRMSVGGRGDDSPRTVPKPEPVEYDVLTMQLVDANQNPSATGQDQLPGIVNYFTGNDPGAWRANIPTYAKVLYRDIYPGIDLAYYDNQGHLEYDFIVAPGADPDLIRLAFEGASGVKPGAEGSLLVQTAGGVIQLREPVAYQETNGVKQLVVCRYEFHPPAAQTAAPSSVAGHTEDVAEQVSFQLASYDPSKPLIIDPVLIYATYLGEGVFAPSNGIAVDAAGNVYVTGETASADFPTVNAPQPVIGGGSSDVFIAKLDPTGTELVYATYLGGGDFEFGQDLVVDASGNVYATGWTASLDFPTVNPFQAMSAGEIDGFVVKLSPTGTTLLYATFLGGAGADASRGITVDATGNVYVTGETLSVDFPTANALQPMIGGGKDIFLTKLNQAGTALLYSTFLGGGNGDIGHRISLDASGNMYIVGDTFSSDFPTVNPAQDAYGGGRDGFVMKLNPTGSALLYSTFLGGSGLEIALGLAVDTANNAYVVGRTVSSDFPTMNPVQAVSGGNEDGFAVKLNTTGALLYATFLGGGRIDRAQRVALDSSRNAYITGFTASPEFPTVDPVQAVSGGGEDAFVVKLNPTGTALLHSSFLGGSGTERGMNIALDTANNVYVTGWTDSDNFATPLMESPQSACCAPGIFVAKIVGEKFITLSPVGLDFGEVPIGAARDMPVTIRNTNETSALMGRFEPLSAPFSLPGGGEAFSLEAGASLTRLLRFSPTSAGAFGSVVAARSTGGRETLSVSGSGTASAGAALSMCGTTLDFGQATLNTSVDLVCTVANAGSGVLEGNATTVSPFSVVSGGSFSLGAGQSQDLTLRFTANLVGGVEETLTLSTNANEASLILRGTGIQGSLLVVNPPTVNFGNVRVGSSRDLPFSVRNIGAGTLTRNICPPLPFVVPNGTSLTLAAGQEQTLMLRFRPPAAGPFNGTLTFTPNACAAFDSQADPRGVVMNGRGVAEESSGQVYVANRGSNTVSVVNTTMQEEEASIPVGNQPVALALTPNARTLYVVNFLSNDVSVVDTASRQEIDRIAVGLSPRQIVISPDGSRAYIANAGPGEDSVSILNLVTNQLITTQKMRRPSPSVLTLSPDGKVLYVLGTGSDLVGLLETSTNQVARLTTGADPVAVAFSPDGESAYVVNQGADTVSVLDIRTFPPALVCEVAVEDAPVSVAVTPDGGKVYVANSLDDSLSVFSPCLPAQGVSQAAYAKETLESDRLAIPDWEGSTELQIDPNDPQQMLVVNSASNNVGLLDTATDQAEATISAGTTPEQSAFDTEQPQALVTNFGSNNITMVNTAAASSSFIPVGEAPMALVFSYLDASSFLSGFLENPQPNSFQSGIGVISGFVCEANQIEIEFDGTATFEAAYGTSRGDTQGVCGDTNNGFSLLFNWNLLGDGAHTVRALADGVEFANVPITVTTLGLGEFPTGLSGDFTVDDFPTTGASTQLRWQESQQNFVIFSGAGGGGGSAGSVPRVLENPQPGSFQSGVGVISGFVCEASQILIEFDGTASFEAAYGTSRADTVGVCSDANNGFSLLFNWNLLGDGPHTVRAFADGVMFAEADITVATLGLGEFPVGLSGTFPLDNFPAQGQETTVEWQQSQQNFVIVDVQ